MNSTLMKVLAVILAIGAVATAWMGYRMSTPAPVPPQVVAPPQTFPQVVAAHHLPAGHVLNADDVRVAEMDRRDPQGFEHVNDVVGKVTVAALDEGGRVTREHLPVPGVLSHTLLPGERGVAVKINEVIGVGGFVVPGDRVDVLLYLRADRETAEASSAQVILHDVRVLAYGDDLGVEAPGFADTLTDGGKNTGSPRKAPDSQKGKSSKSAILAIPAEETSRLLLAESAGTLRLALRGVQHADAGSNTGIGQHFLRLGEIARPVPVSSDASKPRQPVIRKSAMNRTNARPAANQQVVVHKGDKVEVVTVSQ